MLLVGSYENQTTCRNTKVLGTINRNSLQNETEVGLEGKYLVLRRTPLSRAPEVRATLRAGVEL